MDEDEGKLIQCIQIHKFKKYIDGTNIMSYNINFNNSSINLTDDDEYKKFYSIIDRPYDVLKLYVVHDIQIVKEKEQLKIDVDNEEPAFSFGVINSEIVFENMMPIKLNDVSEVVIIFKNRVEVTNICN